MNVDDTAIVNVDTAVVNLNIFPDNNVVVFVS